MLKTHKITKCDSLITINYCVSLNKTEKFVLVSADFV